MNVHTDAPPELPSGLGRIALLGVRCYLRRWLLYAGIAAVVYGIDVALLILRPQSGWGNIILSSVAEAFLIATVSIGVLSDAGGTGLGVRGILDRAIARWWAVGIVNVLLNLLVSTTTFGGVLRLSAENLFGLITILYVALWAAVALATVVTAADTSVSDAWLVVYALNRGGALAFTVANVFRTALIALAMLVFVAAQLAASDALLHRGLTPIAADAYGSSLVNAVFLGLFQAVLTALSLDMARRITAAKR